MDARRLPSATMPLLFGSSIVSLGTPLMVGRLVPLDAAGADLPLDEAGNPVGKPANFRLTEGVVTGRARTNEVLSTVGAVALIGIDGGEDRYLCSPANAILYTFLKASLCAAADTMLDPLDEFAGRPCDSSSVAFQFEASPAQVGVDYDRLAPTDGCGAGWRDTCEPAK